MSYLNETEEVTRLRNSFCEMIRHGGCPSICKMKAWAELKNAVVREAYAKEQKRTPPVALEPFGVKPARTLIVELRAAYRHWDSGEIDDEALITEAHRINAEFNVLIEHGRASEDDQERFLDEYTATIVPVEDVPIVN